MTDSFSYEDAAKPAPVTSKPAGAKPESFSYEAATGDTSGKGFAGGARDLGLGLAKGLVGIPETVVGLGDIVTGGRIGKALENKGGSVGFRPKEIKQSLTELQTDQSQEQMRQFDEADGIVAKAGVALSNPSIIANTIAESLPSMVAGGFVGRGALAAGRGFGAVAKPATAAQAARQAAVAGGVGEGAMMAGSQAEQIRQETEDGLLTGTQAAIAAGTGLAGGAIGAAAGKLASRLGIGDVDTMLVQGNKGLSKQIADDATTAAVNPLLQQQARSIPTKVMLGAMTEGLLEELPQSVMEQVFQNIALGKEWHEDVDAAVVLGTLSGGTMGAGAAGFRAFREPGATQGQPGQPPAQPPAQPPQPGPALSLPAPPAPEPAVIVGDRNGELRTPLYQKPSWVGASADATDVMPKAPVAQMFSDILDEDSVYANWSNVRDGTDRSIMRGEMDYVAGTYAGTATSQNRAQIQQELSQQFKWFRAATPEQKAAALDSLSAPGAIASPSPMRDQVAVAAAQGGSLSSAALTAIDTGASPVGQVDDTAQFDELDNGYEVAYDDISEVERAIYDWEMSQHDMPYEAFASLQELDDSDIPFFDSASNASDEEFLRALGATDEEIANAITPAIQPTSPTSDVESVAGPEANEPAGASTGAAAIAPAKVSAAAAPSIQAITAKQIPDMTDVELQTAIQHYGPAHKRTAKLQKEAQRRAALSTTSEGNRNGPQAPQTQQVGSQPAQAGEAPAVQPTSTGLTNATTPVNNGPQAAPTNGAQAQAASETREQRDKRVADAGAAWTRMPTAEREALASRSTLNPIVKKNAPRAQWADLHAAVQRKLADAMVQRVEQPTDMQAFAPESGTLGPQSQSQAVQDFIDGKRDEVPTVEEVEAESASQSPLDAELKKAKERAKRVRREKGEDSTEARAADARLRKMRQGIFDAEDMLANAQSGDSQAIDKIEGLGFGLTAQDLRDAAPKQTSVPVPGSPTAKVEATPAKVEATPAKVEATPAKVEATPAKAAANRPSADQFAGNKVFTADAVAAARARMKSKLGRLNSGLDPELMMDGMTIAGAYIESGMRSFGQYAKAMVEDMGDGVKPYLLSFWEAARHFPGLDTKDMTSVEDSAREHAALITPEVKEQAAEAVGTVAPAPAKRTKKTGAKGDMMLTQDWGVEHINGYGESSDREGGNDTKDAFLKETRNYLNAVAAQLEQSGFLPHAGRNGKTEKPVSVNESGVAGSGDVSLTMQHPDTGTNVYVTISDTSLRGVVPSTPSGIAIMYRAAVGSDRYAAKGGNTWAPVNLSANDLATLVSKRVPGTIETSAPAAVKEGQPNERTTVQGDGTQALEPVATGASEGIEGSGRTGADAAGGGDQRATPGAGADGAGVQGARGGGGGTERVRPAEAGDGGRVRKPGRVKKTPAAVAAEKAIGPDTRPVVADEPASAPNIPAADFQITDETRLGQGGEVAKFNDNLAAIRVLKAIEEQNRRATPDEQATLARYVGWGGLANAFPDPLTGKHKPAWEARGKELRDLLDDAEFSAARRSTRNAHYTSKPVVQAMWRAVERLGFKGGLALETSMGSGNFLGLKPQGTPASFVGIEYDSLTARIAQALYPQATVLHSGFQNVPLADNAFALSIGNPPFGSESLRFQYKPELNGTSIHNQFFRASMDALRPGGIQAMVVSRFLMDAKDKSTRLALAKQAKLVAAIRLPDTAFKENARTEVVTDIIILQKMTPGEQAEMALAIEAYQQRPEKGAQAEKERQALAAKVPAWVETADVADPLGGADMTVNGYFRDNKANIMGVLERSGSMQHGADITVRLDDAGSLESLLTAAVDRLPQNLQDFGAEVVAAGEQRHKSMSDALRIALAGQEFGHVQQNRDGVLERVVERETPEGGIEMGMQAITAESPWSDQLMQDDQGRWYRTEVVMDEAGKAVKATKADGTATRTNLIQRVTFEREADVPGSLRLGATGFERLQAAVGLRDSLKRQITLETSDAAKGVMDANRRELAKRYEAFVAKFGPVNRPSNLNLLMTMPDGGLTAALEVAYQPEVTAARAKKSGLPLSPEVAKPAPILTERVVPKYEPATAAGSASDALAITLSERGKVDMERIAQLRGLSVEEATAELQAGDNPLVFMDPESKAWETADAYLSGNVRRKLNAAKAARAEANVQALEAVQPAAWGAEDVTVMLGSTWVPPKVYADFAEHLTGGKAKAAFSPATNAFTVSITGATKAAEDWSSQGAPADYILGRLMNSQPVVVMYKDENGSLKRDNEATTLAQLKAKEIGAEFLDWVFKDGERRAALVDLFNEKFNTRVVRQRDGSHLTLPGKVPDSIIGMRRHQKNVIWRGITDNALLMDHAVGAGKTFAAVARAMERRRMGLSKKPMIVVPNHLVDQWATDVYRLYPGAKVLAAGKKDFEAKRRRRLFGKIATGDWDIVLVPHSSFGFIGIDASTEQRFLQMEMDQALEAVKDAADQAAEDGTDGGRRKPFGVKEAERLVEKIQTRMDKLNSGAKDRLLTFEQLGVDDLTVDEAHEFKNLYYSSRMTGVRGMGDKTGSRKANDLYNKVRVLQENPANSVSFLTGTPISNSAVEMFTVMRYLAPQQLKEMGLEHFDAWRAQFVEASAAFEPTESGSLKEVTRLGRSWSNMRSLMDLYYEFTDAVSLEDIQRWYSEDHGGKPFPVPKVKGGDRQLVNVQPTPAQEGMLKEVIAAFDGLADIQDPYERNAERLRLMDRARKVSLDVRAVDPRNTSDEAGGKLAQASANVKRIYDASNADKGTQMVFLDRSVPRAKGDDKIIKEYDALVAKRDAAMASADDAAFQAVQESLDRYDANEIAELRGAQTGGWNAYQQIKDNLVAAGIPANEVRFIQEANNDEQKQALFDAVNSGKVRVLLGSSQRMGAGTNAQKRLVGLHHIDVTWKPSDIEQREGRIIRQGNELLEKYGPDFEVEIMAYATERTVDAKMWDLNATKLKTINGIRKYDGAFSMDFEDADSVSMAEMAALASGNPLLLERVKTESEINLLDLQERGFRRRMYGAEDAVQDAERTIARNPERIQQAQAKESHARQAVEAATDRQAARRVTIEGKEYDSLRDALTAVKDAIDTQQGGKATARYSLTVDGQRLTNKEGIEAAIGAALGDAALFEATINGQETAQHTVAARELVEELNTLTRGMDLGESRTKTVGTMLGYQLALDAEAYDTGKGGTQIDASVSLLDEAGATVSSVPVSSIAVNQSYVTANLRNPVSGLFGSIEKMAGSTDSSYMQRQLDQATKDLPALRERLGQTFPKADELAAKRARLRELVSLLDVSKPAAQPSAPEGPAAIYSSADSDLPAAPLSLDRVNQLVQEALAGIRGAPPVEVAIRPADLGLEVPAGSVGYGVTLRGGDIYVFQSAMGSDMDVFRTVFHELFHRGVRVLVPKGQYVQVMLDLAKGDSRIQQLAIEWKNTEMGQKQKDNLRLQGYSGSELTAQYEALAIEEALAVVAEEIKAEGKLGSKPKSLTVRFLANWLAKVADLAGMKKLAQGIRAMTYNDAERFVMSAISRSGEPVPAGRTDNMSSRPAAEAAGQTQTAAFKRWFGDSKAVDADGKPLVMYHGTQSDFNAFRSSSQSRGLLFVSDKPEVANGYAIDGGGWKTMGNAEDKVNLGLFLDEFPDPTDADFDTYIGELPYGVNSVATMQEFLGGLSEGANVMPLYVKAGRPMGSRENPIDWREAERMGGDAIRARGYDSVWVTEQGGTALAVLDPTQLKSATGNNGDFDPGNADIRFRSADLRSLKNKALDQIHQTLSHPGTVSLWDRSVGTMRNLAERVPAFKPVFEAAQQFIDDVSTLANEAADAAPRLLPRVDSWKDLKKQPISAADNKAVAAPIFEGTLMWARDVDGTAVLVDSLVKKYANLSADEKGQMLLRAGRLDDRVLKMWRGLPVEMYEANINARFESQMLKAGLVWSDKELRDIFKANDHQISLYREARAGIDKSIDITSRADMLRALGEDYAGLRDMVMDQATLEDAMTVITDVLQQESRSKPDAGDRIADLNNMVVTRYEQSKKLMDEGYAPLSRFGRYTVDVVDANGERQFFGMFETKRESNQMELRMKAEFKGATVTQGTMSDEAFKLFQGITPESLEQFASMLNLGGEGENAAQDKVFQEYLKLAKNNHSALKRLIHRKGIAGYSEDVGRVLASFVYSNARLAAGGLNAGTLEKAVQAIPKEQGELRDVAMGLRSYIQDPQEEGQAVRGMLFAQYLGGSVASAMVNMTQPLSVTLPWLSQFGGIKKAGGQMARALKDMGTRGFKYEPGLALALHHAEDDGTVSPQEVHQLMAQARGAGGMRSGDGTRKGDALAKASNAWEKTKVAWGQPFALAEQFNRRSTFIAAYRTAKEQGMANPAEFARKAVLETQFLYSKANKMRWARGAVGGTLMTFKTYSVSYLELMHRMWNQGGPEGKRAVGWSMAMLMLMGGAGGLPFMEDAEDLIDGAGQLMGYNFSLKEKRQEFVREWVGKELGDFMESGLSGLPGAPIDVSGRLGMGNLIPGTGLALSKQNRERDLMEIAGPAGDLVARGFAGARKLLTGDVAGAAMEATPTAVRNAVKGIDMAATGIYTDTKGYKVIDTTLAEAASKFLGFQPRSVAEVQEANSFMQRSKSFYTQTSGEIKAQWADALFRKDESALNRVRERLASWNRNNPDQPIIVKMPDVWKRVREMGKDRTDRIAATAPKALRAQMREAAQEVSR